MDPVTLATPPDTRNQLRCPVCSSGAFEAFNGRENARCTRCRSMERTRLQWMILDRLGLFRPGQRVLHFAPEMPLAKRFSELSGDRYHACDIDPSRYPSSFAQVRPFDLCTDLVKLPSRSFDLIIHNHVLEHLACDVEAALVELERILAPGGHHLLSVPVRGDETRENLDEDLLPEHRTMMFGQHDHYRIFGAVSLPEMLGRVWGETGVGPVEPLSLFSREQLEAAAVPEAGWTGISSHSVFHHQRPTAEAPPPQTLTAAPPERRPPAEAGRPRLLLHIGMPKTGTSSLQRWLLAHHDEVLSLGLDSWSEAENHSELMFSAFAADRRTAAARMWFQKPGGEGSALGREDARGRFDAFAAGLGSRTGLVSAESLWTFQPDEVRALGAQLDGLSVDAWILCWVRSPAEYFASAAQQRCKTGMTLAQFTSLHSEIVLRYRRLEAWIETFGEERVIVRPYGPSMMADFASVLEGFGVQLPKEAAGAPKLNRSISLPAAKALLALNERRAEACEDAAVFPALLNALRQLEGEPFALPGFIARRMGPAFAAEDDYLASRFSVSADAAGAIAKVDDDRFLRWTNEEVGALLEALNKVLLAAGKPGG